MSSKLLSNVMQTSIAVESCGVSLGNVSWMFEEGQRSNFRLRRGVGQAAHTSNNPYVKYTGVYCA
jgi:hypothetical protein